MESLYKDIIENSKNKSNYMWNIITQQKEYIQNNHNNLIPKKIIQYWDSSDNIPTDVLECMKTWRKFSEAKIEYILFSEKTAKEFIEKNFSKKNVIAFEKCIHPALQADYFRLCYMVAKGGAYIDADDVCLASNINYLFDGNRLKVQGMCYDLKQEQMINTKIAYAEDYREERIYYINNNPLIAPKNNPILKRALETATKNLLVKLNSDFQAVAGPGNLVNSVIWNYTKDKNTYKYIDIITDWEDKVVSKWPLDYRKDERNWRNFKMKLE